MMPPFSSEISTDSHRHQETPAKSDIISPRSWLVEGQRRNRKIASHVKKKVQRAKTTSRKCNASRPLRTLHPAGHELFLCALLALLALRACMTPTAKLTVLARDDVVSAFSSDWLALPTTSPDLNPERYGFNKRISNNRTLKLRGHI